AKLQERYEFEKDAVNKPETRSYVTIPVKDAAQGADVAARLSKGEDPTAVAKSVGKEPVTNADKPKTAISDKTLADAVFSTDAGKATAPVTTALGMQVAKVTGMTPGRTVTLEQMRPQLESELKADAAKQKAYDASEAYTKAKTGGATMEAAATAAGAKVEHYGPLNATGVGVDNKPVTIDAALVKRAFTLKQGEEEPDVVDMGNGEYSVIRVAKVEPKHTPAVDEVRTDLTKVYIQNKTVEAVQAKAKDLAARWSKGEDGAKLAAEAGGKLTTVTGLNQEDAQSHADLQPLNGAIFNTKLGEVTPAPLSGSIALVKVTNMSMPDNATLATYAMDHRTVLEQQIFQDLTASLQKGVRQEMRVKTNLDKARLAMGMDTDTVKKLSASAKAPAKTPAK
ncbi:MAG: PpiC-type peptidyl-prolyl cis-trans isomerase, partial [Caulobacteraceae bacterium]|nr:PpiC-type peptidyl-prolyl cis-trans isomerase [Caulobacteraceae bacterium]